MTDVNDAVVAPVTPETQQPPNTEPCQVCGLPLRVGDQGCIVTIRPHEPTLSYHPFIPYFDIALGEEVTSLGERWTKMKGETTCDGELRRERLEYRDKVSPGELSARRDRMQERRKEEVRQGLRHPKDV